MKLRSRWSVRRDRRHAAELLVEDDFDSPALTQADSARRPELGTEIEAMCAITTVLAQMPAAAWDAAAVRPSPAAERRQPDKLHRLTATILGTGLLATVCLIAAFIAGSLTHPTLSLHEKGPRITAATPHVVLLPLSGQTSRATAVAYMSGADHMLFTVHGLPRSAPGTFYELWLMTSARRLVPISSFRVGSDGDAKLKLLLPDDPYSYAYLDLSVQRVGASPAISTDSVLRGAIRG